MTEKEVRRPVSPTTSTTAEFTGPLFLVGMPRSGTKLLRDMLNNHSRIGITPNESHFIPQFHARWNEYGTVSDPPNFHRFYTDFSKTVFFQRVTAGDEFISEEKWRAGVREWTYPGVIEAFYRLYAEHHGKSIWGDKTPYYLVILPLLKSLFPRAKFVHIIRDVRDYVLSMQKGWNKNMYRAAQRWHDAVKRGRQDALETCPEDYHEVRYEELVDDPAKALGEICLFLGVVYEEKMPALKRPADRRTEAGEGLQVQKKNYGKWKTRLSRKKVMRLEELCGSLLSELGYSVSYNGPPKRISSFMMKQYQLFDGFNLLRAEMRMEGVIEGIRNVVRLQQYSKYRSPGEEDA